MGFPRSDEARREDSLYDRIGQVERKNRQQDEKIAELKQAIQDLLVEVKKRSNAGSWWNDSSVYAIVKKYEQFLKES